MALLIDLVVARYGEDAAWIDPTVIACADAGHRVRLFVYDKKAGAHFDGRLVTRHASGAPELVQLTSLPNVGRESHTYLVHVLRMRERVRAGALEASDVTVFLQGSLDDHLPPGTTSPAEFVLTMATEAGDRAGPGHSNNHGVHLQFGGMCANPLLRLALVYPIAGDSGAHFLAWFEKFVGDWPTRDAARVPRPLTWYQNGIFGIRTARVLDECRPDAHYADLVAQLGWHVNPEAGHYMERSWYYVFPGLHAI